MMDRRKVDRGIVMTACLFWVMAILLLLSTIVVLYLIFRPLG